MDRLRDVFNVALFVVLLGFVSFSGYRLISALLLKAHVLS